MSLFQHLTFRLFSFAVLSCIATAAWAEDSIPVPYSTTSTRDTLIAGDSVIIIHTVCAPVCSSSARAYTRDGQLIATLYPPFRSPFPEAYIQDGKLLWRDNLPQILDEEERRHTALSDTTTP